MCVCFQKTEIKGKRQEQNTPEDMTPGQTSSLENAHYEFEGQAHKRVILLDRNSTEDGLFESGLRGWEEFRYTDGVGPEGISGQGWQGRGGGGNRLGDGSRRRDQ